MKKKIIAAALALALALTMAACGGSSSSSSSAAASSDAAGSTAAVEGLKEAFAESPILLTSGGQSADYQMINLATSADLGDAKTLVVVAGGSSKGLGAAGIDADGELARLTELLDGAKEKGLSIIVMHTGGEARRGDLSDKFIAPCFEKADYAIVVAAGDSDGLMSGLCAENGIPMDSINSISDVTTVLPAAFK